MGGDGRKQEVDIMHLEMMADIQAELPANSKETKKLHLFTGEEEVFAFQRCVSRLAEMGTRAYKRTPHNPMTLFTRPSMPQTSVPERPDGYETIAEKMWKPREFPQFPEEHWTEDWGSPPGTAKSISRKRRTEQP